MDAAGFSLGLILAAAIVYLLTPPPPPAMYPSADDEPIEDRDPGDETDEDEVEVVFVADFQWTDAPPEWCMCPKGHVAHYRPRDGAIFCDRPECGLYAPDFRGFIDSLPEAA